MTTWETAIADGRTNEVVIRGKLLDDLITQVTFSDLVYLLFTGSRPTDGQRRMIDAIFVSLAERGIAPSTMVARSVTANGSSLQAAVSAGLLTIGDRIGGASEEAARLLAEVAGDDEQGAAGRAAAAVAARRRLPGFGYPEHEGRDPRTAVLLEHARTTEVAGRHCEALRLVEAALEQKLGREVPANVNGALAAIALDLGLSPEVTRGLLLIPRVAGLVAHVAEQVADGPKWYGADPADVAYTGPDPRGA